MGEIEIEFKECVRVGAVFICIRNMSVCLHYMLRYVCGCVPTHCYSRNQQRLEMLVTSLDFIETRERVKKGSKTSDMQKHCYCYTPIRSETSELDSMSRSLFPYHIKQNKNGGRNTNLAEYLLIIA